ncbi:MAG: Arc family DNA-binding protein [Pseudonocardiales bacterium]|jgi:antitoxin FitA|nr:Arc family DNA-binding protein [Pseudonocardiales bacterium]
MAAISVRNLDEWVKERLRVRAARHGRSMESEIRSILEDAVREPDAGNDLFEALLDRVSRAGGVDVEVPARRTPARAAEFDR